MKLELAMLISLLNYRVKGEKLSQNKSHIDKFILNDNSVILRIMNSDLP